MVWKSLKEIRTSAKKIKKIKATFQNFHEQNYTNLISTAVEMFIEHCAGVQLYSFSHGLTCFDGFPVLNVFL